MLILSCSNTISTFPAHFKDVEWSTLGGIFTESAPRQFQSVCLNVCPLHVTFELSGMETFGQRGW